ncbi:MFS transporter [Kitasatospora aureofaciens]|uniref:MFS transporter n=1 Tax=Kitasatospora aureofaciens TaxID=1894 RepID=UPI0033D7CDA2
MFHKSPGKAKIVRRLQEGGRLIAPKTWPTSRRTLPAGHPLAQAEAVTAEHLAELPLVQLPPAVTKSFRTDRNPTRTPAGMPIPPGPTGGTLNEILTLVGADWGAFPLGAQARRYHPRPDVAYRPLTGAPPVQWGLLTLVHGIAEAENGITRLQAWLPLVISAIAGVLFVLHERRATEPVLEPSLFHSSAFTVAALASLTLNFIAAGFSSALGQFGSVVLTLSPRTIGLLYLPGTLLVAGAVVLAGRLIGRYTPRPVLITGMLVLVAGGLLMAVTAGPTMALWILVLATWLTNLGSLVASASVAETILSHAPPGRSGAVASVQPAFGMTGYALGPAVYLLLFNLFFRRQWLNDADARGLSETQAAQAVDATRSAMAQSPATVGYDPNLLRQAGLDLGLDFTDGLRLTMLVTSLLPLALAVAAYFLMPRRVRPTP